MPETYDIVLIPFPFTDLSSAKLRPALVVGNPHGDDIIVAFITSDKRHRAGAADVRVKKSAKNGLKADSCVRCAKLATLDTKMLVGEIGSLEKIYQTALRQRLKKVFGL